LVKFEETLQAAVEVVLDKKPLVDESLGVLLAPKGD